MDAEGAGGRQACADRKAHRAAGGEIDRIIEARDRAGLLAAEAYMIVHHPQWQRARDWIEAGEIGEVRPCRRGLQLST
jgi:hypothetical protein